MFAMAKGVIALDTGISYGQPVIKGIRHKCPLLFCPNSKLQWLEMEDMGCKSIDISTDMTRKDINAINHYINDQSDWGEENYRLFKQFYSMRLLKYIVSNMLSSAA